MNEPLIIHWFRQDLRLADNPALHRAAAAGRVLPVFVLDDVNAGSLRRGAASRWWLHHSLAALDRSLQGRLVLLRGDAMDLVPALAAQVGATAVHWNRCYEPWRIARDTKLKEKLAAHGVAAVSTNGSLLWEPWDVSNAAGKPYQVFTPFYRKGCLNAGAPRLPLPRPEPLTLAGPPAGALPLAALELLPRIRWDRQLEPHWQIGEEAATARLAAFLAGGLRGYREGRDFPARPHTSRLSPALHFGEVSPNQLWYGARAGAEGPDLDHFLNELAWREFSYALLYHHPTLPTDNLQPSFDAFPWDDEETLLRAWQRGLTGIPFVDAGMRELWQTGWMHNRVRMVTGSFLVKNLLLHWRTARRGSATAWSTPTWPPTAVVAVGGRLRRGCCALFPHLQSRAAGPQVRPRRRLHAPLRSRTGGSARSLALRAVGSAGGGAAGCGRHARGELSAAGGRPGHFAAAGAGGVRGVARRPVSRRSGNAG
jgi:deoxyribodipyrimidine photo-lyase